MNWTNKRRVMLTGAQIRVQMIRSARWQWPGDTNLHTALHEASMSGDTIRVIPLLEQRVNDLHSMNKPAIEGEVALELAKSLQPGYPV